MNDYQGIARKFRPQVFAEVVGQEVVVTTLKNAIKFNRLGSAYLFCGSRGTGKTTLARLFAKALNCLHPTDTLEPCNECVSCKEIISGSSLDVLEIDGASNRSIEDIRKINDTVAYASSNGKFKIYIIDEVHMLTKEAFNALLKTLEEPPPKVKFFFATTEAHKVLPTILSRCQRFNLKRISIEAIIQKLDAVAKNLNRTISSAALRQIAIKAEGGLRDAESLLDQIFAYYDGVVEEGDVVAALGIVPKEIFFTLDKEGKAGNLAAAFALSAQIFADGKDLPFFVEGLLDHFRNLSVIKLSGKNSAFLHLSKEELEQYEISATYYSKEQLLMILDICMEAQQQIRHMPSLRIALESLLLRIMRTHQRIPIEHLVERLTQLEHKLETLPEPSTSQQVASQPKAATPQLPKPEEFSPQINNLELPIAPQPPKAVVISPKPVELPPVKIVESPKEVNISEDPSPSPEDVRGFAKKTVETKPSAPISKKKQAQYDTLLQFAAVELEGRITRK